MTITVIGHLCLDELHFPDDEEPPVPRVRMGGIIYSVVALANLMTEEDRVIPVFGVGTDEFESVRHFLARYPNVDTAGIYKYRGPTNRVHLFYDRSLETRKECSSQIAPPIPFSRIKPFLSPRVQSEDPASRAGRNGQTDGILINMVSGFDITLETLDLIRMEVRERGTPIHFDFHSLTLGIDEHNLRFRRPLTDWRRWCFFLNSIQMSHEEAAGLTSEHYDEPTLINQLMPLMVNSLVITRGRHGVTLITQKNKKLSREEIPGISLEGTLDPTGCGDVFGAAFLYGFLRSGDAGAAARFANRIAAFNATASGPEGLERLPAEFKSALQTKG